MTLTRPRLFLNSTSVCKGWGFGGVSEESLCTDFEQYPARSIGGDISRYLRTTGYKFCKSTSAHNSHLAVIFVPSPIFILSACLWRHGRDCICFSKTKIASGPLKTLEKVCLDRGSNRSVCDIGWISELRVKGGFTLNWGDDLTSVLRGTCWAERSPAAARGTGTLRIKDGVTKVCYHVGKDR